MGRYSFGKMRFDPKIRDKEYPGWWVIDCGCCGGLCWGGYEPVECERCGGSGVVWWHEKSRVFAAYPGGKFLGKGDLTKEEEFGENNEI